jgi:hypothetical protein
MQPQNAKGQRLMFIDEAKTAPVMLAWVLARASDEERRAMFTENPPLGRWWQRVGSVINRIYNREEQIRTSA